MSPSVALVVGLGNPGPRYEHTRHNAGFWLADRLAAHCGQALRPNARFAGELAELDLGGRFRLLKPQSFMNRSGQPAAAVAHFYRLAPEQILVVHDDLDLPPGAVRLKRGGGHGGHNGLRDIMAQLGSREFLRLRLGIGHPGSADEVIDYVLTRPSAEDRKLIDEAIDQAVDVFARIIEGELDKAMTVLHSKPSARDG